MPVLTENPVVIPAQPEKVYDKLWVVMQHSSAPGFGACSLNCSLRPYRADGNVYKFSPTGRISFNDDNLFDLHVRKPYVVEAIKAALAGLGIAVPDAEPAQLIVMELIAHVWGAAAQAKPPEEDLSSSKSSSSSEDSDPSGSI